MTEKEEQDKGWTSLSEKMKLESIAVSKWTALKSKCQSNKITFDLTVEDIKKLQCKKTCEITGVKIYKAVSKQQVDNTLTFDRIFPSKGYVKSNVIAVSKKINEAKGCIDIPELKSLVKFYLKKKLIKNIKELTK